MVEPKHTPGPWAVDPYPNGLCGVTAPEGDYRATIGVAYCAGYDSKATATLFAAAPELAEALRGFVRNRANIKADDPFDGPLSRLMDMSEAALAKAGL